MAGENQMNFGAFNGNAQGQITLPSAIAASSVTLSASPGLTFSQAASRIVPGATSLSLRNTANDADNLIITNAGAATVRAGLTVTAGGVTVTAGGLLVTAGRIREVLTPADIDAQDGVLTAAHIAGGIVVHTSATGGGTLSIDSATNIVAGDSGVGALTANGQVIKCYVINDGDQTLTLGLGTGITLADAGQTIATNESALLLFRRTSATAVTVYTVGA